MKALGHTFFEQLVETGPETFLHGRSGAVHRGKTLRREARDLVEDNRRVFAQRIADLDVIVSNQTHHVAGPCVVHRLAFAGEQPLRVGQTQIAPGAGIVRRHVAPETAGNNPDEGDPVAMARVHVGLHFEDEAGKGRGGRRDRTAGRHATGRRGGELEKAIEEETHPEVVHRAAEENRGLPSGT